MAKGRRRWDTAAPRPSLATGFEHSPRARWTDAEWIFVISEAAVFEIREIYPPYRVEGKLGYENR
jgi:hypothetical protein